MNGRPRASRPTPGPCPGATGAPEGKSLIAFQLARSAHYIPPMQSAAIRRKFLDYFTAAPRSHREVPSSSLVPADDPSLLFTNAGMVQFKRVFQGLERRDYSRAVTCQKCVRAGGKHNDLEQVGHTARHHTFFEMLGNFSFGDYFKSEAIEYAWEWVTGKGWLGIAPERLFGTVHHTDDEARRLWRKITGIPDSRIFGLGDKDNFWQMGETGPCGPCSEILVDIRGKGEAGRGKAELSLDEFVRVSEAGQLLEIWNLVFMQYDQQPDASRIPLPAPSVDTGAGLERIAAVMQGVPSNFDTIEGGLERLDELQGTKVISGEDAFKLYDTYGFPIDLTQLIAAERGQTVDIDGFERALGAQRERSREDRGAQGRRAPAVRLTRPGEWRTVKPKKKQKWVGYETTKAETDVLRFRQADDRVEVVLEDNPFYAESGGQVSDTGQVKGEGWELDVSDVEKVDGGSAVVGHFEHEFEPTAVLAQVHERRRRNIERNHTATHLVHAALRKILGTHVRQQGSVVAPDRLRFDFAHHGPIDDPTLGRIEEEVNAHIWENLPVETRQMKYKAAIARGAIAFFSEKYGDIVRVVDVPGVSLELCGGTHVPATGQIALFRFTHETGAAAGIRRMQAVTGPAAYELVRKLERQLDQAASVLRTQPEHLVRRIEQLLEENRKLERRVEGLVRAGGATATEETVQRIGDVEVYVHRSELDDRRQIGTMMDSFRVSHPSAVSIIVSGTSTSPGIHVGVADSLIQKGLKAGDIVQIISASTGGKGGGRPHFASGSIGDAAKLDSALSRLPQLLGDYIKKSDSH